MAFFKIKPICIAIAAIIANPLYAYATNSTVAADDIVNDTVISEGDNQYVYGTANNTTINYEGLQDVYAGGVANNTVVDGTQFIGSGGHANNTQINTADGGQIVAKGGSASQTTINDGGLQHVPDGGKVYDTIIMEGGQQWIEEGSVADKTEIRAGGKQIIQFNGVANNTTIEGGTQEIRTYSTATNTTINSGTQNISGGGQAIGTEIRGNGIQNVSGNLSTAKDTTIYSGTQILSARGSAEKTTLATEDSVQIIEAAGTAKETTIDGGTQRVEASGTAKDTLVNSGTQKIMSGGEAFNTTLEDGQQIVYGTTTDTTLNGGRSYLFGGARAEGYTEVNNDARLVIYANAQAEDVTLNGGTLQVASLSSDAPGQVNAQVDKLDMNGGNVVFSSINNHGYAQLNIGELNGSGNFRFQTSLADKAANFVTIGQGTGSFGVIVQDSGKEIADHTDLTVNLINDQGGDIDFALQSSRGGSARAVDGGAYMYVLKQETGKDGMDGNVWYLGALTDEGGNGGGNNGGGDLVTTPSTDAVLNLANAGLNIMRGEMDGLRGARQDRNTDLQKDEGNVWGHYLGKKSAAETSNGAAYKLYQNGMELGADTIYGFDRGNLVTGGFVSLTSNNVKHSRGGTSSVDSYGLGAYATWYDNNGFYLDGVVKANRLESKLNARMTNGDMTSGKWHQYGLSAAFEAGYTLLPTEAFRIEPFARVTGTYINDANVALTNGMTAQTGKARSLTAEAGTRVGTNFQLGNTMFRPYLSASVEQELAHSNEVVINQVNQFKNHQNGTSGKYGVGLTANPTKDMTLYGELNYRNGSFVEEPVQGVAGIRISF